MAEVLLGAFLEILLDRLASPELLNVACGNSLVSELSKLETTLNDIKGVLADAENRDMSGETAVRGWLDDLRDLIYDADDLLDELAYEAVNGLPPSCCPAFLSPRRIKFNCRMTSKVNNINGRFDAIIARKNILRLLEGVGRNAGRTADDNERPQQSPTSLPDRKIFGRDKEIEYVLKLVMDETQEVSVIPIFGMGGSGKTTIAQSIYNHEAVKKSFGKKAWACVSDEFNMVAITKAIVEDVGGAHDKTDLNGLQVELQRCLSGQKFLIVLDDVWNEDYSGWDQLRKPFESSGLKGSKIIVTTRSQTVAGMMKNSHITEYRLGNLSESDSWALLAHHALDADNFDEYSDLKPEAEKIVNKCGGLPLATKSLGGLLRSSKELSVWKDIAESEIWDLPKTTNSIPNALNLSYVHLPSHLKRCFVYCAVFPKDYEFDRDHLILLWMAEGLLKKPNVPGKSTRDVGLEYFKQLLARSFFQPSSRGDSVFLMHDLMNDLAASKARPSSFSLGEGLLNSTRENRCHRKVRHLSLIPEYFELSSRFEGFQDLLGLRTFLALGSYGNCVADKVIEDAFCSQKRLRVLSLRGYRINEVPNYTGRLRRLRYLNLSKSNIKFLPTSMSALYNLETLILRGCENLMELPGWITKLINLRCIDVRETSSLRKMPGGLGDLVNLEILTKFIVGGDNGARLKELKDMMFLAKKLCIEGLSSVAEVVDARHAALNAKTRLTCLNLSWQLDSSRPTDGESEMQVLNLLQPHARIKKLGVEGYGGTKFPCWMGDVSFVLMEKVTLHNCRHTKTLPTLGLLPVLKEVIVKGMDVVYAVGAEFYGNTTKPFQCLENLSFDGMHSWEEWSLSVGSEQEKIQFPRLRKLELRDCLKLKVESWPDQFPALVELVIRKCPLLQTPIAATSVPALESAVFEECDGRVMGDVVSRVRSLKSLSLVNIEKCDDLISLWDKEEEEEEEEEEHHIKGGIIEPSSGNNLSLIISNCNKLVKIGVFPRNLVDLRLEDCEKIKELPKRMPSSLKSFELKWCDDLMSLWDEEEEEEEQHVKGGGLIEPSAGNNLSLVIWSCNKLVKIGAFPPNLASLCLIDCEKLEELPKRMPSSLKRCVMMGCKKVRRLPEGIITITSSVNENGMEYDSSASPLPQPQLEELRIEECLSLMPFRTTLVPSLKNLRVSNSILEDESKRSIILTPQLHTMFTRLTYLSLWDLPTLELECFPQLPPYLQQLVIYNCPGIKSLPQGMHSHLSLLILFIIDCQGITSFPEEGLPPHLETLCLRNCENLRQPMSQWGFHRTTALKELWIGGKIGCLELEGIDTFPPPPSDGQIISGWGMLPPSLTQLRLWDLPNLVSLSSGMHTHLTLLKELIIKGCPKLQQLPREGFPASLCSLSISGGANEELKRRLSKPKEAAAGKWGDYSYFPFIQHIPRFWID